MCKVCIYPGASCANCPEQDEPRPTESVCEYCGHNLYVGEHYWDIDGTVLCTECSSSNTTEGILEWLGYRVKEA